MSKTRSTPTSSRQKTTKKTKKKSKGKGKGKGKANRTKAPSKKPAAKKPAAKKKPASKKTTAKKAKSPDFPYEVRKSPIHGKGVFATERIPKGTYLGIYAGKRTMKDGTYVLWVGDEGQQHGVDGTGDLRYLNHSSRNNCEFEETDLWTVKSIPKGAEITIHYGEEWEDVE